MLWPYLVVYKTQSPRYGGLLFGGYLIQRYRQFTTIITDQFVLITE